MPRQLPIFRKTWIEELYRRSFCTTLDQLCNDRSHQTMIGMTVYTFRTSCDDNIWSKLLKNLANLPFHFGEVTPRWPGHLPEFAILEFKKYWRLNPEFMTGATCFVGNDSGELLPVRSSGRCRAPTGCSFLTSNRHQVNLRALPGITCQKRSEGKGIVVVRNDDNHCRRMLLLGWSARLCGHRNHHGKREKGFHGKPL